ncbi:hypothetical protein E2C01_100477 [Portunus trituberculatus]|uniref:Uncharacterized protein n=1 Tax=Portunus trituberculatus TaxID=210409 RepID=A0A5B7KCB5_PORTR|nr:hypothetical protein [Portunus trituberculatus]
MTTPPTQPTPTTPHHPPPRDAHHHKGRREMPRACNQTFLMTRPRKQPFTATPIVPPCPPAPSRPYRYTVGVLRHSPGARVRII